jgi:hypothetical protein
MALPLLAASLRAGWPSRFTTWADARPPLGPLRDGWDFAQALVDVGELPEPATTELAEREAGWPTTAIPPRASASCLRCVGPPAGLGRSSSGEPPAPVPWIPRVHVSAGACHYCRIRVSSGPMWRGLRRGGPPSHGGG